MRFDFGPPDGHLAIKIRSYRFVAIAGWGGVLFGEIYIQSLGNHRIIERIEAFRQRSMARNSHVLCWPFALAYTSICLCSKHLAAHTHTNNYLSRSQDQHPVDTCRSHPVYDPHSTVRCYPEAVISSPANERSLSVLLRRVFCLFATVC